MQEQINIKKLCLNFTLIHASPYLSCSLKFQMCMSTLMSTLLRLEFHASHSCETLGGTHWFNYDIDFIWSFHACFAFPLYLVHNFFPSVLDHLLSFQISYIIFVCVRVCVLCDFSYNKTEDLAPGSADMLSFSHLMLGVLSENRSELAPYASTHTVLYSIPSYSGLGISWNSFPFLHIKTRETLWVLKRFTDGL